MCASQNQRCAQMRVTQGRPSKAREKGARETRRRLVAMQERKGIGSRPRGMLLRLGGRGREEGSCLVDLLTRHQVRELVAAVGARGVTSSERAGIPSVRSYIIEWQASPLLVQVSQGCFRAGQAVLCGKSQPSGRFPIVEFDT